MSDQSWDGLTERRGQAVEGGTLQAKLDMLNQNVERLTNVVDENTKALSRLAVLEVNHNNSEAAIERAFKAISKNQQALEDHVRADETAHRGYDKLIWLATGFVAAISIFWTLVGYRVNSVIDDQMKTIAEMRMHIHDDKVTSPEHVKSAIK